MALTDPSTREQRRNWRLVTQNPISMSGVLDILWRSLRKIIVLALGSDLSDLDDKAFDNIQRAFEGIDEEMKSSPLYELHIVRAGLQDRADANIEIDTNHPRPRRTQRERNQQKLQRS
jgi:hypothetical protein